jgi:2-succinyl-6-hydroxy-2,4-cyclohexadiene-1-carboxylate synthase
VPERVVLLDGFGGTHRTWDAVAERLSHESYLAAAPDLPGHGAGGAGRRAPPTFDECVRRLLGSTPDRFVLCGYSLGGRVALHVALAAPERVSRLVLVSTGAGIEDPAERAARRHADEQLARMLEREPFDAFVRRWNAQELFADDPEPVRARARADMLANDRLALAAVLRGLGTGAMAPLWSRLSELGMPVQAIAGARDRRYAAIAGRIATAVGAGESIVIAGGHRLALESPDALARAIAATGRRAGRRS